MFKANVQRTSSVEYSGLQKFNAVKWISQCEYKLLNRGNHISFHKGFIYFVCAFPGKNYPYFYCINTKTGRLEWSVDLDLSNDFPDEMGIPDGARFIQVSEITIFNDVAYFSHEQTFLRRHLTVYAIDLRERQVRYKLDMARELGIYPGIHKPSPSFQDVRNSLSCSSPLVYEDNLYIGTKNGYVYCLEAKAGEFRWKLKVSEESGLGHLAYDNGKLCVISSIGCVYCVDTESQTIQWRFEKELDYLIPKYVGTSPTLYNNSVYICHGRKSLYSLQLDSGEIEWEYQSPGSSTVHHCAIYENVIYAVMADAKLHALNASSGEKMWVMDIGGGISSATVPLIADGLLYMNCSGTLKVIDVLTGKDVWQWENEVAMEKLFDFKYSFHHFSNQMSKLFFGNPIMSIISTPAIGDHEIYFTLEEEDKQSYLIALC